MVRGLVMAVWREKLSSDAKQLVNTWAASRATPEEELHDNVDVLVRTTRTVSSADRRTLELLGVTLRTVAGDVLTARIPVNRLEELADLDLVAYVETARPLSAESSQPEEDRPVGEEP